MIHKLELNEFTVFKKASLEFGKRINVLIGENGSGKTQILKFLYASLNLLPVYQATRYEAVAWGVIIGDFQKHVERLKKGHFTEAEAEEWRKDLEAFKSFRSVFNVNLVADLVNLDYRNKKTKVLNPQNAKTKEKNNANIKRLDVSEVQSKNVIVFQKGGNEYKYHIRLCYNIIVADSLFVKNKKNPFNLLPKVLFLPTRELLTIFPHYLALRKEYQLPYDSTYDDTIGKLGLPLMNEDTKEFFSIVKELEEAIDGRIFLKDEKFYFHPNSAKEGQDLDINMTAEGWRKLGMLLQLLRNGGLRSGMVLLWDEPEANLNPRLIRLIAHVLIKLSMLDIQVFITTHSLFLLREIDMLSKSEKKYESGDIRYFNFVGKGKVEQGNAPEDLDKILLLDESLKQSDRFLKMED